MKKIMKREWLDFIKQQEGIIALAAHKKPKKPIMSWVCTYTPLEIIIAAGFYPYRLLPAHIDPSLANSYLDSNFCPYVRSCLGEGLTKKSAYLDNLIIGNSCDAMRRLYDAWRHYVPGSFIYLLDLPRNNSPKALEYYQYNLQRLIEELESRFAIKISEDLLYQAILVSNKTRKLLTELSHLYAKERISISATEFLQIIQEGMISPPEEYNIFLGKFLDDLKKEENILLTDSQIKDRPKVLISGTVMDNLEIARVIEDCGGKVVFVDMCTGERYFSEPITLGETKRSRSDLLRLIAEYYLNKVPCPRMVNLEKRWTYLLKVIKDYEVKGVIFYNLKFCDTSMFELPVIRERLQKSGIPTLCLEGEFASAISGGLKTRIQAFMEVLEFV